MALQTYITPEQVRARLRMGQRDVLSEYLGLAPGENPLTNEKLGIAIESAAGEIDAVVVSIHTRPFDEMPYKLTNIAFAFTLYFLMDGNPERMTDEIRDGYRDAREDLALIRDGKLMLVFPPENRTEQLISPAIITPGVSNSSDNQTTFRNNLDAY